MNRHSLHVAQRSKYMRFEEIRAPAEQIQSTRDAEPNRRMATYCTSSAPFFPPPFLPNFALCEAGHVSPCVNRNTTRAESRMNGTTQNMKCKNVPVGTSAKEHLRGCSAQRSDRVNVQTYLDPTEALS